MYAFITFIYYYVFITFIYYYVFITFMTFYYVYFLLRFYYVYFYYVFITFMYAFITFITSFPCNILCNAVFLLEFFYWHLLPYLDVHTPERGLTADALTINLLALCLKQFSYVVSFAVNYRLRIHQNGWLSQPGSDQRTIESLDQLLFVSLLS